MRWFAKGVVGMCVLALSACSSAHAPVASPTPSACDGSALILSWGDPDQAAGTQFRTLIVTNSGTHDCAITQSPSIRLLASGKPTATIDARPDSGATFPESIPAGHAISLIIATPNPDNFDDALCHKVAADQLSFTLDSGTALTSQVTWPTCTTPDAIPYVQSVSVTTP